MTLRSTDQSRTPAKEIARSAEAWSVQLRELMYDDAMAFRDVIAIRRDAKTLREKYDQDQALRHEIQAMKSATEIPLEIAALTLKVAEKSALMVERGFATARGESYSALLSALAATDGAIYVARLNIKDAIRKAKTLNDPEYERPWVNRMRRLVTKLTSQSEAHHARQRDLFARFNPSVPPLPRKVPPR